MRQLPSGENTKLALVAIASISTVGLFTFLALHQPDREPAKPDPAPRSVTPPALELRREPAETPRPPQQEKAASSASAEPPVPDRQGSPERAVEADDSPAELAAPAERTVERARGGVVRRLKHKIAGPDPESKAPTEKRSRFSGAVRSPAAFGTLPNKKCGPHDDADPETSSPDPFSGFIGAF